VIVLNIILISGEIGLINAWIGVEIGSMRVWIERGNASINDLIGQRIGLGHMDMIVRRQGWIARVTGLNIDLIAKVTGLNDTWTEKVIVLMPAWTGNLNDWNIAGTGIMVNIRMQNPGMRGLPDMRRSMCSDIGRITVKSVDMPW